MKTYHMYNTDSINAESKLKEAEKQEEKQMGRSGRQDDRQTPRSPDTLASLKSEEKPVRRSSVKKIEKMKEKVGPRAQGASPVVFVSHESVSGLLLTLFVPCWELLEQNRHIIHECQY